MVLHRIMQTFWHFEASRRDRTKKRQFALYMNQKYGIFLAFNSPRKNFSAADSLGFSVWTHRFFAKLGSLRPIGAEKVGFEEMKCRGTGKKRNHFEVSLCEDFAPFAWKIQCCNARRGPICVGNALKQIRYFDEPRQCSNCSTEQTDDSNLFSKRTKCESAMFHVWAVGGSSRKSIGMSFASSSVKTVCCEASSMLRVNNSASDMVTASTSRRES